jgi:hypothetical protein
MSEPTKINEQQTRGAQAAALEVLSGAPPARILEQVEQIALAKAILRGVVTGQLVIGPPPAPAAAESPPAVPVV